MTIIYTWLAKVSLKVWGYILAGALVVGWFLKKRHGYIKQGEQKVIEAVRKETEKVDEEWRKIDSSDPTVDDAIDELRSPGRR